MIFPRTDILDLCKVSDITFWPLMRQEISRTAGGSTQGKDFGSPLWRASFTTAAALITDAAAVEAALMSLNGVIGSFLAYDARRPYPAAYPTGNFNDTAVIDQLFALDAFSVKLAGLDVGTELRPGDYFSFEYGTRPSRALHMVTVGDVAGSLGKVTLEVFPAIRPGADVATAVTLKRPPCEMILEPGLPPPKLLQLVASNVTFSGIQIF